MWHVGIEYHRLARAKPIVCGAGLDGQVTPKTVNDDMPWGPMLGQMTAWLEYEQEQPKGPAMNQARLPMPILCGVGLGQQPLSETWKMERDHGASRSSARMRPEPLLRLIHISLRRWR